MLTVGDRFTNSATPSPPPTLSLSAGFVITNLRTIKVLALLCIGPADLFYKFTLFSGLQVAALKFCFKTCVAMKFVDDDDDDDNDDDDVCLTSTTHRSCYFKILF